jgi:hypothetical protein
MLSPYPSFAQKWQAIAEQEAAHSQQLLHLEGIDFWDAQLAHRWRMLRKDLRYFEALGDTRVATDIMLELDAIRMDDEALEQRNRRLLGLDTPADFTDPDYLLDQWHDQQMQEAGLL